MWWSESPTLVGFMFFFIFFSFFLWGTYHIVAFTGVSCADAVSSALFGGIEGTRRICRSCICRLWGRLQKSKYQFCVSGATLFFLDSYRWLSPFRCHLSPLLDFMSVVWRQNSQSCYPRDRLNRTACSCVWGLVGVWKRMTPRLFRRQPHAWRNKAGGRELVGFYCYFAFSGVSILLSDGKRNDGTTATTLWLNLLENNYFLLFVPKWYPFWSRPLTKSAGPGMVEPFQVSRKTIFFDLVRCQFRRHVYVFA